MKKTQLTEIIKGGKTAIAKTVASLKSELLSTKLKGARGEVKNIRQSKIMRRDIARLLTAKESL